MTSCPCSIFDVREEQILESSGSLRVRLICNVCGSLIDSKVVTEDDRERVQDRDGSHAELPIDHKRHEVQ